PEAGAGGAEKDVSGSRSRSARRGSSKPPSGWERCSPLFEIRRPPLEFRRLTWVASAVVHVAIIVLAFSGSWRIDRPQGLITIIPPARPQPPELPPFGGTRRGAGPSGGLGRPVPSAAAPDTTRPVPAPVGRPDTTLAASPAAVGPHIVSPPQVGDGRLWVLPRPALLPISLPQGNYDEQRRARQLDEMRQDLMQAARRTETLRLFKQYVRDLRARKQAERDAERRARGDTVNAAVDTVKAVP